MDNKKVALIVIILLLVISVPGSIIGIIYKRKLSNKVEPAPIVKPSQEFFQNGNLNFYEYGNLIGIYKCKNPNGYCGWAYETIDDNKYNLNYYNDNSIDMLSLVSSRFAFLVDVPTLSESNYEGEDIYLYDVMDGKIIETYKGVKNYTVGINNNYFILKDSNEKWGVVQLNSDGLTNVIPFEYDYIGLKNNINESSYNITANMFAVLKNQEWFLIDLNNTLLSKPISNAIIDYNNDSIIVNYYSRLSLFNYNAVMLLDGQSYNYINYIKNYVGYIDIDGIFSIVKYSDGTQISKDKYLVSNSSDIETIYNENGSVDVYISGEFKETIQ